MSSILVTALALTLPLSPSHARGSKAVVVYEQASAYEQVYVVDKDGYRYLRFGSVEGDDQSVLDLARPDVPILEYIPLTVTGLALADKLERGLLVGFGAGSVTRTWHALAPEMWIDSVEIDPVVTALAYTHFQFTPHDLLPVHVMDGRAFVNTSGGNYDVVMLDAFGAGDAPYHLTTAEFYAEIKAKLAPGGVVMANMVAELNETLLNQARTFNSAFATVYRFETPRDGNVILLGTDAPAKNADDLAAALSAYCTEHAPEFALGAHAVNMPTPEGTAEAAILKDREPSP